MLQDKETQIQQMGSNMLLVKGNTLFVLKFAKSLSGLKSKKKNYDNSSDLNH